MRSTTLAMVMFCGLAAPVAAQLLPAARPVMAQRLAADSGWIGHTGSTSERQRIYSAIITSPGASWMRLSLGQTVLSGNTEIESATTLVITSLRDGEQQILNADHLRQWAHTSAYFNGDSVRVELFASPGTGLSRVTVDRIDSAPGPAVADSLCSADDRVLSSDNRVGRLMPAGCTAFLISDTGRCLLTAGSCTLGAGSVVQFNVPLSEPNGALVHPSPRHQYPVDAASVQSAATAAGDNWAYFGVHPNSNTQIGAAASQGSSYALANAPTSGPYTIRIAGYGTVTLPISMTWNQVQKVASGPLISLVGSSIGHQVDTTTGNEGSPIQLAATGEAIGIHTGDGCVQPGGPEVNTGTAVQNPQLQAALASPAGICSYSVSSVEPPIYLSSDAAGRLVTVNRSSGGFGAVGNTGIPGVLAGLAYDRGRGRFYASRFNPSGPDELYILSAETGAATLVGIINATPAVPDVSGLAYDPNRDVLYGIDQGSGRLYRINFETAEATPIGIGLNPNVGAIEFEAVSGILYGIEDDPQLGSRLIRIDTVTGIGIPVGLLGAGFTDCDGLAYSSEDRFLYTVNQSTSQVLQIDPATGQATVVGDASPMNGPSYGMAGRNDCSAPCTPNTPSPAVAQFEVSIFASMYWSACPNQKVFAVDATPRMLYDVLTATAQVTPLGTLSSTGQISGMTWNGEGLHAIDLATGNLFHIDTDSAQATLVGSTGITGWQGLASDPTAFSRIYGITQNNNLYRIAAGPGGGGATELVAAGVGSLVAALEFDNSGQLWGIEFSTGRILKIDKNTGAITHIATTIAGMQGLDFDDAGAMYGYSTGTHSLYTINTASGVATLRGQTSTTSIKSIAFGYARGRGDAGGAVAGPTPTATPGLYDPTDLTRTTPIRIDPAKLVDETHRGTPAGFHARNGILVPGELPLELAAPQQRGRAGDASCGGTLIDFDDDYAVCAFELTTRLTTRYAEQGVIFEGPGGRDGGAVLNTCANLGISGHSGDNVLAFNSAASLSDGGVPQGPQTLRFPSPVSSIQVMAASPTGSGDLTVAAYRGAVQVASRTIPLSSTMAPVLVLGGGITHAVITSTAPSFALDDVCFVQSCPTRYDFYFGPTNPPPLVVADSPNTFYRPPVDMDSTTLYYWRVVARNCCGQTEGPLWHYTTLCYPNCDGSTIAPILNIADFSCFLQKFAAGDIYANCDNSSVPPVLNIADFSCFLQRFAAGCPGR
jgi:V8-like Glu-specific endopeptidase